MNARLNPKVQNILSIFGIAFIGALIFLFHQAAETLAFKCLKEEIENTAFRTVVLCVRAVTSVPWQIVVDVTTLEMAAFPSVIYVAAHQKPLKSSVEIILEMFLITVVSIVGFIMAWFYDNPGLRAEASRDRKARR